MICLKNGIKQVNLNNKSGYEVGSFPHYLQYFIHPKGGSLRFLNHQQYLEGSQ